MKETTTVIIVTEKKDYMCTGWKVKPMGDKLTPKMALEVINEMLKHVVIKEVHD